MNDTKKFKETQKEGNGGKVKGTPRAMQARKPEPEPLQKQAGRHLLPALCESSMERMEKEIEADWSRELEAGDRHILGIEPPEGGYHLSPEFREEVREGLKIYGARFMLSDLEELREMKARGFSHLGELRETKLMGWKESQKTDAMMRELLEFAMLVKKHDEMPHGIPNIMNNLPKCVTLRITGERDDECDG